VLLLFLTRLNTAFAARCSQTLYEQARVLGCWQLLSNQKTAQGATKYVVVAE